MASYGVFNTETGNLIDSFGTRREALALVIWLLTEEPESSESVAVVIADEKGSILETLASSALLKALPEVLPAVTT